MFCRFSWINIYSERDPPPPKKAKAGILGTFDSSSCLNSILLVYLYKYMHAAVLCMYIYKQTDERDRQTDRQIDRDRDRKTETETDRQTEICCLLLFLLLSFKLKPATEQYHSNLLIDGS